MSEFEMIPLDAVRINGGTQSRAELNQATIAEYAEAVRQAVEFPPVVTFFDGVSFWLADGFHRFNAHKDAGAMEISAEIRSGTQRDAILYSVGANASHGLRRTNEDKRRAVMTLLNDSEWSQWSDREIARCSGVTHPFVASLRNPQVVTVTTPAPIAVDPKPPKMPAPPATTGPEVAAPAASVEEVAVAVSVELVSEVQALREQVEELAGNLKSTLADNEMMGRAFDADDKLKAAMDEAARQKAIADSAERTLAAKNGEFVARAEAVKYWQNRAEKAEKKLKALEVQS